jgi:hypothetical protein
LRKSPLADGFIGLLRRDLPVPEVAKIYDKRFVKKAHPSIGIAF